MKTIIGLLIVTLCFTTSPVLASHQYTVYLKDRGWHPEGECSSFDEYFVRYNNYNSKVVPRMHIYHKMYKAIYTNNFNTIRQASTAEINTTNYDWSKSTPLLQATKWGKLEIVKLLIDKGANINHQNVDGVTALHYAAVCGNGEIVQYLLVKGAATQINDKLGLSPVIVANVYGHPEMANLLTAKHREWEEARAEKRRKAFQKYEGLTSRTSFTSSLPQQIVDQNKKKGETLLEKGKRQLANAKRKLLDSTAGRVKRSYNRTTGNAPKQWNPQESGGEFDWRAAGCLDENCKYFTEPIQKVNKE